MFNWIPTFEKPDDWKFGRNFCQGFSLVWWNMEIVQLGQHTILRDIGFGNYTCHLEFEPNFWSGEGDRYNLQGVLEGFYFLEPDGDLDPTPQPISVSYRWHPVSYLPYIQFKNTAIPVPPFMEMVMPLPLTGREWSPEFSGRAELPVLYDF